LGSRPQSELQPNSSVKEKVAEVWEVSVEEVKDSPLRLQLEGAPHEVVELVIEPPCDLVEYITKFKVSFNKTRIVVNNSVRQLRNFVTLFCDSEDVILVRKEDNVEVKNIL